MYIRRLFAIGALILIGGILAACGTDDDDAEPTAESEPTVAEVSEVEPTEATDETEVDEIDEVDESALDASPEATPADADATAVVEDDATPVTATEDAVATPETDTAVAEATPEMDAVAPVVGDDEEATPETASPEATAVSTVELSGTLTLEGRAQQDFTLNGEGCVGLGEWRQLSPGSQVIVRDASGTVVDVAELEGVESDDACMWNFAIEAPEADYFSVSIPMVTEVWFDQNDPAIEAGELELIVP